jgi:endonuclease G
MTPRDCLVIVALLVGTVTLRADFLEVRRPVTLKATPAGNAPGIAQLQPPTLLPLVSETQQNGYYQVLLPETGERGWVYRTFVRRRAGQIPAPDDDEGRGADDLLSGGHCLMSCPSGAPSTNQIIAREIYTLSNNGSRKFADWVAYAVTASSIGPTRPRDWKPDPLLAADATLEPEDYAEANATVGTDRGHQAPLASFTGTTHWKDTNLLSDITPQKADLNQGPWERLESAERALPRQSGVAAVFYGDSAAV